MIKSVHLFSFHPVMNYLLSHYFYVKVKDFECRQCSQQFSTVSGVKRHIQIHHNIEPTKVRLIHGQLVGIGWCYGTLCRYTTQYIQLLV